MGRGCGGGGRGCGCGRLWRSRRLWRICGGRAGGVSLVWAWGMGAGTYAGAEGEVPAETHARAPDAAVAVRVGKEVIDRLRDILVVRVERLESDTRSVSTNTARVTRQSRRSTMSWGNRRLGNGREGAPTLVIFHSLPLSVPGTSYARGSGPVNSWYELGAATT